MFMAWSLKCQQDIGKLKKLLLKVTAGRLVLVTRKNSHFIAVNRIECPGLFKIGSAGILPAMRTRKGAAIFKWMI
jgi:hypothetical protein